MSQKTIDNDLFNTQKSIFQPQSIEQAQIMRNKKPIIVSQFSIHNSTVQLQLFQQSLVLNFQPPQNQSQTTTYQLTLNHSIKASFLTQKNENSTFKNIGFRLFANHDLTYDFISPDEDSINQWMKNLSKVVILWGFSQDFKAIKYIGRGQFGQVWQVERSVDGKKFAAKMIDKEICFGQVKGEQSFYNEIQILRKLNHPNIVHLECIYESQKNFYIVQELVEGRLLSQFVKKSRDNSSTASSVKLKKRHNIKIMKNLLKALQYLHKNGIAHRDLKPGNIIINPETKRPCIIDFGLSQFVEKEEYLFQCCGSPGYMAPQIFQGNKIKDITKCDVFSLGAIFYMVLAQAPLFDGNSTQQIIDMTKQSNKLIHKKIKSSFSGSEAQLLNAMLETDPEKRITAHNALSHQYFTQAVYDLLQQIRQPLSQADDSSKYSLKINHLQTKFDELLCDSAIVKESNFQLNNFLNEQDFFDDKMGRNMVTPSDHFTNNIKRRVNRYMSEQNIEVDDCQQEKDNKSTWSGKWRKIKDLQEKLFNGSFWPAKDFIFERN